MAVAFANVGSKSGLEKLDKHLLTRSYITGYQASKDDITVYAALSGAPSSQFVNISRWFNHIDALLKISGVSGGENGVKVEGFAPIIEESVAVADSKAADDDDDDDVDHFGEETKEEKKGSEERGAAVRASGKKKESGKSSILMDVKPDEEADVKKLEEPVRTIQMEGLLSGARQVNSILDSSSSLYQLNTQLSLASVIQNVMSIRYFGQFVFQWPVTSQ